MDFGLRKFVAPEIAFGCGARHRAGQFLSNLGATRVLVVTDAGVVQAGWTDEVIDSLRAIELPYVVYSDVTPNPRADEVMAGAAMFHREGCDALLAIGGGSPMDCAKGIGIVHSNARHILEFEGVDEVRVPIPPLVCVPTTGGTSADVSQFAIITNLSERIKFAIISKAVVPDVSLVDPETLTTMPAALTSSTAMDALVHAIEAYVSNAASPMTDIHALEAIRLIVSNVVPMVRDPENIDYRHQVMLGSLEAGLAFSNASLGATHAMAHSLGGVLDLPHGQCNAMLLCHVMAFNFPSAAKRFSQIGRAMGMELDGMTVQQQRAAILAEVDRIREEVGISMTLSAMGVHRSEVAELSRNAMRDPCMVTNPRQPVQRDIEVIYEESL